jgi:hypothetical protein
MREPQQLTTLWASTACYRDSFTLLFFINLSLVLYGSELWSLTILEEQRLRVLETRMIGIFEPNREAVEEAGDHCIMKSFTICTLCQTQSE